MENRIAPVAGKSMVDVKNAHGGNAGASIVERIQDELDLAYEIWTDGDDVDFTFGMSKEDIKDFVADVQKLARAEAISECLAILRSTTPEQEWKLAEERYSKGSK